MSVVGKILATVADRYGTSVVLLARRPEIYERALFRAGVELEDVTESSVRHGAAYEREQENRIFDRIRVYNEKIQERIAAVNDNCYGDSMPRLSQHPDARKSRARRKQYRKMITEKLGGKCDRCGGVRNLEPHHKAPRDWESRRVWAIGRLLRYLREIEAGVPLGLLCRGCNAAAGIPAGEDSEF